MTNYSKTTNFTAKDSLVSGDANKIVKGAEIDVEFDNIATASATKANIANPTFTGVVSFPDGSAGAPSITNTGDTNAGLFFSAADTLAFAADGTAQFTFANGVIAPVTDNDIDLGTSSLEFKDGYFDGTVHTDAINLNGTAITSTAAELNILDGVTSTAAELNILDGVTATAAELNYSDTGSSVGTVVASKVVTVDANKDVASFRNITLTGELDAGSLDISGDADIDGTLETDALSINGTAVTSTAAELNILDGVTATAAELNILDGVTATTAELNYVDGVTSAIQTQLDAKAPLASPTFTGTVTTAALTGTSATFTTADNTTQLTLASTDADSAVGPILDLFRNSASPGNFDLLGKVLFSGEDSGGNKTEYAHLQAYPQVVTDGSESGYFELHSMVGGTDRVRFEANATEVVVNNPGIDSDFRVESDSNTHALFVEGSTSNVGIGTSPLSLTGNATPGLTVSSNGPFILLQDANNADKVRYMSNNSGELQFGIVGDDGATGKSEHMRIDSSGNVLVGGTTFDNGNFSGNANGINVFDATHPIVLVKETGTNNTFEMGLTSSAAFLATQDAIPMIFATSDTERMRITAAGEFCVGGVINGGLTDNGFFVGGTDGINVYSVNSSTSSSTYHVYDNGGGAYKFFVNYSGTISATNTTVSGISDIRWKENIRDLDDGLSKVMQLQPRKFDWKEGKGKDVRNDRGFIAQEFETVFPDLIDDWIDPAPEGEEPYKAVRADLIPTLVKAIQEQQAIIEALTARVAQLEQN